MDRISENKRERVRIVTDAAREKEYADSLSGIFDELVEIHVSTGQCGAIFFTEDRRGLSVNHSIDEFRSFAWEHIHPEDCHDFLRIFDRDYMERLMRVREPVHHSFRFCSRNRDYAWFRILLIPDRQQEDILLCYVAKTGGEVQEDHMLRQMADQYIYRNCEGLIYLDASRDSYFLICRNEGASLFPADPSGSYSRMMRACIDSHVAPEDRDMVSEETKLDHVMEVLDREGEHGIVCGVMDPDNGYLRKRFRYAYYDRRVRLIFLMCTDITKEYREQHRQKECLRNALEHARIDSLTGLYNRQTIQKEIIRSLGDPLCPRAILLFMDLDNFKSINDTMGHRSGDQVLCRVADLFRRTLRASDLVGRIGGDEFVAFLTGAITEQEGMDCARRLCDAVAGITEPGFDGLMLSCSIGGAVCPRDGKDYDTLFVKADTAAYEAKRLGRNQCVFYMPGMGLKPGTRVREDS